MFADDVNELVSFHGTSWSAGHNTNDVSLAGQLLLVVCHDLASASQVSVILGEVALVLDLDRDSLRILGGDYSADLRLSSLLAVLVLCQNIRDFFRIFYFCSRVTAANATAAASWVTVAAAVAVVVGSIAAEV